MANDAPMNRPHFIFGANDFISRFERDGAETRLLAKVDDVEVHKQTVPAQVTFFLDSADEWQGFEFIYLLQGKLRYLDLDAPALTLGPGDYIARHLVNQRTYFKAEADTILLYLSSQPSFQYLRKRVDEYVQLAEQIERDEYTDGHCRRIQTLARRVGERMGLTGPQLANLLYAAFFHDLGKAKVSRQILRKQGPLTAQEWEVMKQHTVWGSEMLSSKDFLKEAAAIVEQTHETVDGTGYPKGLKGEHILLEAKIIAVVDAYDAMTTDRPYRRGLPQDEALQRLQQGADTQFEPKVVSAFRQLLEEQNLVQHALNPELAQLRQHQVFLKISEAILSNQDIQMVLDQVVSAIVSHSSFRRAALALYAQPVLRTSTQPVQIVRVACAGLTPEEEARLKSNPLPPQERPKLFDERFKVSHSYYIPHDQLPWHDHPGFIRSESAPPLSGTWHPDDFLCIPLGMGDKVIGILSLDEPQDGRAPTHVTLEPIEVFANFAALAIERARHVQALQVFQRRLKGIYRLSEGMPGLDSIQTLIDRTMDILVENFSYEHASLFLKDGDQLVLKGFHSVLPREQIDFSRIECISLSQGVCGWVAMQGRPALVEDTCVDPRYLSAHPDIRAELAVPILDSAQTLGVLNLESVHPMAFSGEDLDLLQALARQLGERIANLRRQQALQDQALHDPLTQAFNRHYLSEMLSHQLHGLNQHFPVSLIMIDFVNFRKINDRFGHLEGDRVLREATACFQQSVRSQDAVIRYGGDEFLVVLPDTTKASALRVCSQLKARLKDQDWGMKGMQIAIRTGVATWEPGARKTFEQVLEEADAWLFRPAPHQEAI